MSIGGGYSDVNGGGLVPDFSGRAPVRAFRWNDGSAEALKDYKDILAKSGFSLRREVIGDEAVDTVDAVVTEVQRQILAMRSCAQTVLVGACESGHKVGKILVCGREWCDTCGRWDGEAHMRRYARLVPKIVQVASMGFFTVQLPLASREFYRDAKMLSLFGKRVTRAFQKMGFARGIRAWDWFGDPRCPVHHIPGEHVRGESPDVWRCKLGCQFGIEDVLESDMKWHPHLNVLVDGGFIAGDRMDEIKRVLADVTGEAVIVHYEYSKEPRAMLHWARYAVKPTFRSLFWDLEMVSVVSGFRGIWSWGDWKGEAVWTLEQAGGDAVGVVVQLGQGVCPLCSSSVGWHGGIRAKSWVLGHDVVVDLGGGYLGIGEEWRKFDGADSSE